MVLSAVRLLALVDGIIEAPDRGWGSLFTVGELAVAPSPCRFRVWEAATPTR